MGMLENRRALIVGVASQRSIATGIAEAMHREGAEIALTYQNEKLQSRVQALADKLGSSVVLPCDVAEDRQIQAVAGQIAEVWPQVDILVHSVGFAPGHELGAGYLENATREGFRIAHDISVYSFTALAQAFREQFSTDAALLTLSYLGAERVVPNYNVMGLAKASLEANVRYIAADLGPRGVRANAISAGPIKTLAAAGIRDFRSMLQRNARTAPLRRNVTIEEVGNTAAFLCSGLASGITGETVYVDAGYHAMAMFPEEESGPT